MVTWSSQVGSSLKQDELGNWQRFCSRSSDIVLKFNDYEVAYIHGHQLHERSGGKEVHAHCCGYEKRKRSRFIKDGDINVTAAVCQYASGVEMALQIALEFCTWLVEAAWNYHEQGRIQILMLVLLLNSYCTGTLMPYQLVQIKHETLNPKQ